MEENRTMELNNDVAVDAGIGNDMVPVETSTDLVAEGDDGNAALGIAILVGAGTLIGIAGKTVFDKVREKVTNKEDKPEKAKKKGFFSKFKKDAEPETEAEEDPEVVADAEAKEVEPQEEAQTEEKPKGKGKK